MSKHTILLFLFCTVLRISICYSNHCSSKKNSHSSSRNSREKSRDDSENIDGPCMIGHMTPLTRVDGIKVGHVFERDLGDKTVKVITRAMKPPVFEIPDFLSSDECDHIISVAKQQKLENSLARGGLTKKDDIDVPEIHSGKSRGPAGRFYEWDFNHDGVITPEEAILFAKQQQYLRLTKDELMELLHKVNVTEMDDGKITIEEFETLDTLAIEIMIYIFSLTHPKHRHRYSEQTWIDQRARKHDPVMNLIQERILKLTGLSKEIIYGSERIQVVRYTENGHYHAHYDSETHTRTDAPCCHQVHDLSKMFTFKNPCRLCRYITILYYLNDVESGGETAFPVADNATMNRTFMEQSRSKYDYYNLSENCKYSNLLVKPKKGLAIMWYNHLQDDDSGWLGAMDDYSLHGGCAVHQGVKWIANNWITSPYKESKNISSVWLLYR